MMILLWWLLSGCACMGSSEKRWEVIHRYSFCQTHQLSEHFQWGDNYNNLNLSKNSLRKRNQGDWEIYLFWGFILPQCIKRMGKRSFEFGMGLLWISSHFWQPSAITTLKSMDREACQVHINSWVSTEWIDFLRILCFENATQDAKSWICECCQSKISLESFWQLY